LANPAVTGHLLAGAVFRLAPEGSLNYREVTTNQWGEATVTGLQPGTWILTEVRSPTGYILDDNPRTIIIRENVEPGRFRVTEIDPPPGYIVDRAVHEVTIAAGQRYELTITNTPRSPILIRKVNPQGYPLEGAEFVITTMNGAHVATVQSLHTGYAIVPNVEPGWFVVSEVRAP